MTLNQLSKRLLRVINHTTTGSAPENAWDDVVQAINWAYQFLWTRIPVEKRTHYTRRFDEVELIAGTNTYTLSSDVQGVLNPAYLASGNQQVSAATHKSTVLNFGLAIGNKATDVTNGRPEVYYVNSSGQSQDDGTKIELIVAPTPAAAETLKIEVEVEAPEVVRADLCSETPPALRIPNDYAESLLYPVAAHHIATHSTHFNRPERLAGIDQDYQAALALAGVTDPSQTAVKNSHHPGDK